MRLVVLLSRNSFFEIVRKLVLAGNAQVPDPRVVGAGARVGHLHGERVVFEAVDLKGEEQKTTTERR